MYYLQNFRQFTEQNFRQFTTALRRAVSSIPTTGPCAAFFAVVPVQILKCIYAWITNPNSSILILIPPSEVQETRSLKSIFIRYLRRKLKRILVMRPSRKYLTFAMGPRFHRIEISALESFVFSPTTQLYNCIIL
jgi:hypothetical protein